MVLNRIARLLTWLVALSLLLVTAFTPPQVVRAEPLQENPDSSFATPLVLTTIGKDSPVQASIGTPGDEDGFQFVATLGNTYVVELSTVNANLGQGNHLHYCGGSNGYYRGLALAVHNTETNSQVALQCSPNGNGDVLTSITFRATSDGAYKLKVYAQVPTAIGTYNLRVLPKYGEAGAAWDAQTYEPNNSEANAYALSLGHGQAITAAIEPRDSLYTTNSGDDDWYRFEAIAGRTYVVELFNVSANLGLGTALYYCNGANGYYRGMALFAFDTTTNTPVARQCLLGGSGNVLTTLSFKATSTGTYTLLVYGHVPTEAGTYSLRVLPKYGEAGASWDATTFEPNNSEPNAYPLTPTQTRGITAVFEPRDSLYFTQSGDNDWYTFQAKATETYTVEVTDIGGNLGQGMRLYYCDGANGNYRGIRLAAFDTTYGTKLASRCEPNSSGNVYASLSFKALADGPVTLLAYPHVPGESGSYRLRILSNIADPGNQVFLPMLQK